MATRNNEHGGRKQPLCPYLTRFDAQQNRTTPVDYPSFENHCLALDGENGLPLTDQATFCLSGSYSLCDRFVAIQLEEDGPTLTGFDAQPLPLPDLAPNAFYRPSRQVWSWAGAAIIFAFVLLVGGTLAAYTGWQLVLQGQLLARNTQPGQINTLSNAPTVITTPVFLVVTASSPQLAAATPAPQAVAQVAVQGANQNAQAFPEAVTPTPIAVLPPAGEGATQPAANQSPGESVPQQAAPPTAIPTQPLANILLPTVAGEAPPAPLINVLQEIPTRRPTPEFALPTSTPVPLDPTATPSATPTLAILGTPVVIFGPDESAVPPNECTNIRWHVQNVREVYYENQAAFGDGVKEACIKEEANTYALTVIFGDGQTKIFTTTLNVLWPTATPTLTPSFTPEPIFTETWTPEPPTATPTPNVFYAVSLRINGGNRQPCVVGTTCEAAVLVTNLGDHPDNLTVEFIQRGSDSAWLCRQDGQCADQKLALTNVGQGNTVFVVLRQTIPTENLSPLFTHLLRVSSNGSQGTVTSETVTVEFESKAP